MIGHGARRRRAKAVHTAIETLEQRRLFAGTWTTLSHNAPGAVGTMLLLPDGTVMTTTDGDGAGSDWAKLTPVNGSYAAGTWSKLANANDTRLFDSSVVMQNGSVYVAGGEYGTGNGTGEVYNPLLNKWTRLPAQSFGGISDAYASLIGNGNVLEFPVGPSQYGHTTIYNPTTNVWSQGPQYVRGGSSDEQSWVKLADGSILTIDGSSTSERYIPATNTFVNDGAVPEALSDSLGEYGPGFLLASGKAIFFGASGHSVIYTPTGTSAPGSWVAGPDIPGGLGEDDASGAVLRDGTVLITAGPIDSYNGPTTLFLYDPVANSFSSFAGPNTYGGAPFLTRMLALPNGDVLYTENGSTLYQYDPGTTPLAAAVPTIASVTPNADGSVSLVGTNLNGINTGAGYGDDAQMDSNYPVVRLTSGSNTYYGRSYNWSSNGVMLGSTSETVNFRLPVGIPAGNYSVVVTANGVASAATPLTVSMTASNTAPTIATAATAGSPTATGTSVALSVLGADNAGESNLTYTWINTATPGGAAVAGFSVNGSNAAKNTTAIFQQTGTYGFVVNVTDAGGLSVNSSSVTVVVTSSLSSIAVTPTPDSLTVGQTQQLAATGYDQFGNALPTQPAINWSIVSGTGTVSPGGLYTTAASGTLASVQASSGTIFGRGTVAVVNLPWTSADIGKVAAPGLAYDSGAVTTISAQSDDIWNLSDDFHFDYQTLSGDVTITAKLASRTSNSGYIKAGLMIRNSLAADDVMAMEDGPPGDGSASRFQFRTATTANSSQGAATGTTALPIWLRLVRSGSTFTGFSSTDGVTWTQTGTQTLTMGSTVYVGLALSSHDTNNPATVTFTNVGVVSNQTLTSVKVLSTPLNLTGGQSQQLIAAGYDQNGNLMSTQPTFTWSTTGGGTFNGSTFTAPSAGGVSTVTATSGTLSANGTVYSVKSPFTSADLGTVNVPGYAYDSGATTTLFDQSDDIWNQSDDFHFDYQTLTGNGTFIAKLNSQTSNSAYIKAGVMMRNSLAAGDVMAMECDPTGNGNGPLFEWRTAVGTNAVQTATTTGVTPPIWLKLVRNGTTFTGYSSSDGVNYTQTGTQSLAMGTTIYVGLALTSHDTGNSATAVFSNVSIAGATAVATAAAAAPNPVAGTTTALSVLGSTSAGESTLTYTWAATNLPAGATAPAFSINGTNAAKNTVATFTSAGTYTFTATITDTSGQSVTSSVTVTVNQTLTSIKVTPVSPSVALGTTQTFTATAYDQFNAALTTQPTFTWTKTSGVGSISATTGVYTAGTTTGTATIQAASGSIVGTDSVTVFNSGPTIVTAAAASPNPTTTTTATLSVLGNDPAGESTLTYTWAATNSPTGATSPSFSVNGTNAAKNTVATFFAAGSYTFTVTITDASNLTRTSAVVVTVNPAVGAVTLPTAVVAAGVPTQATVVDQFGNPYNGAVAYSVSGGGTIDQSGLFTGNQTGGTYTLTAVAGQTATTAVTVVPTVYTGGAGADTYAVRLAPGTVPTEQVFVNQPTSGSPTYSIPLSQLPSLTFAPTAGDGTLTIDFTNGSPLPTSGVNYTGGPNATATGNALYVVGSGLAFSISGIRVIAAATPGSPISYSNLRAIDFDLAGGGNSLTQLVQPQAALTYNAGAGANTLNVGGGSYTFTSDPLAAGDQLSVHVDGTVNFAAQTAGLGVRHLSALDISGIGSAYVLGPDSPAHRTALVVDEISIGDGGILDLGGNDLVVHNGNLPAITDLLASGYDGGAWGNVGIDSAAASTDPAHLTALGVARAVASFDGQTTTATDVLVKYTYYGDANLDGVVDGSDYSLIDNGFLAHASGWQNGDFNYDGVVDGSDYTLIDNAFNLQSQTLTPTALIASKPTAGSTAPLPTWAAATPADKDRHKLARPASLEFNATGR